MAHNTTVDILSLGGRVKCQDKPQIVLDHPIESVYDGSAPAGNVNAGNRNSDNPNVGKTEGLIERHTEPTGTAIEIVVNCKYSGKSGDSSLTRGGNESGSVITSIGSTITAHVAGPAPSGLTSSRIPLTTPVIKPFKTISIPNYVPEFTSEVKGKVIVGIHSATGLPPLVPATTDKPSATIAIPDYVPEFTSNFDEQFLVGNHSPSGLPTPVPATIIDPSGGISVVPTNGPIVSFDPDGHVSVIGTAGVGASVTASAESNNAAPMTFSPTLVTLSKGPTISVDATGGVSGISASALSEGKHKTKTHHTTKTHQATKMHKTHYHHTKNPVSISVIPGLHTSFPGLPAPKPVTSVDSTGGVHIITGSQGTASTLTDPTGGVNVVATSSVRCGVPMPNQSFTTTLVIPMPQPTICGALNGPQAAGSSIVDILPLSYGTPTIAIGASGSATIGPRGQGYTLPGCTLASSSFTTTSLAPSTLLRLARRFPGHYIDQDALRIGTIGPVETSLGTKDSSDNIVYDESNAATPWKPWGAQSGAGEVYTLRYYIPKQLTLLVAIVVSVLVAVFGSWIVMRSVLSKRAKRRH